MTIRTLPAVVFALFIFILPIPGTIALRHVLLVFLFALLIIRRRRVGLAAVLKEVEVRALLIGLGLLSAWLVIQAVWISDERAWAIKEILGQWLPAMLSAVAGILAVQLGRHEGLTRQEILGWLVLALLAQAGFCLLATLPDFFATGAFPQSKTPYTGGKLEISFWNNLLFVFFSVDAASRLVYRQPVTSLRTPIVVLGALGVVASNFAFGARNGVIQVLVLLLLLTIVLLWQERNRTGGGRVLAVAFGTLAVVGLLGWTNYRNDPRWAGFEETAGLAWNSDKDDVWLHPDDAVLPKLQSGKPVDISAYVRIAWIRAGLDVIHKYPLGVGYGRNAFGHALRKTRETRLGHSHSGLIDWTIGTGIPGLALWFGFMAWLTWLGVRRHSTDRDIAGLILMLVVVGFFARMLLDSTNRDHMLILFFLTIGMLVAMPKPSSTQ
jgi:hypothetical protein